MRTGDLKIVDLNRPVFQPDINDFRYPFTIPVPLEQQLAAFLEQDGVAPSLSAVLNGCPAVAVSRLARGQFEVDEPGAFALAGG
jgi:hypothetical protein